MPRAAPQQELSRQNVNRAAVGQPVPGQEQAAVAIAHVTKELGDTGLGLWACPSAGGARLGSLLQGGSYRLARLNCHLVCLGGNSTSAWGAQNC